MAESGAQLFARLGGKENLGDLHLSIFSHIHLGLRPGDVVEFCGGEGTAKSELLLNITAHCVLPKSWNGTRLPGKNVEVVYISTDYKFDLLRLVAILEGGIHKAYTGQTPGSSGQLLGYEKLVESCLSRVHTLYCSSSTELLATLHSLKAFVPNHPEVCALILDNVASFYWIDRFESGSTGMTGTSEYRQQQWVSAFKELVEEHHLVAFAAKPHLFGGARSRGGQSTGTGVKGNYSSVSNAISCTEFMSKSWQRLVKYRFHLQKSRDSVREGPLSHDSKTDIPESEVLHHARMFGTFTAQQVQPVGPVYRFVVLQRGMEFSVP